MNAHLSLKTRLLAWIWRHTLTCKEVTRLVSQSLDQPLTPGQRLRLRLHFLLCVWCQRYARHLKFIHRVGPRYAKEIENVGPHSLSIEAKRRIKRALQSRSDG
jgi:hypothetical protein